MNLCVEILIGKSGGFEKEGHCPLTAMAVQIKDRISANNRSASAYINRDFVQILLQSQQSNKQVVSNMICSQFTIHCKKSRVIDITRRYYLAENKGDYSSGSLQQTVDFPIPIPIPIPIAIGTIGTIGKLSTPR